jgi:RHS repeat-associated protein
VYQTNLWKVFGPDLNGRFGGLQGTGGLEAVILDADGTTTGVINDQFGNGVATVSGGTVTWNTTRVGAYGPLPGIVPQTLGDVTQLAAATAWRSHRIDPTGFYWLGARYYEPTSGRFLSADPAGHAASPSLYDYANGDPANRIDPDGRKVVLDPSLSSADRIAIICINSGTNASATDKANWQTIVHSSDTYTVGRYYASALGSTGEYDPSTKTIKIDPTAVPVVFSTGKPLDLEQVWGHEVSHAAEDARNHEQFIKDVYTNTVPIWDPNQEVNILTPVEEQRATAEENQISDELGITNKRVNYRDVTEVVHELTPEEQNPRPITKNPCTH